MARRFSVFFSGVKKNHGNAVKADASYLNNMGRELVSNQNPVTPNGVEINQKLHQRRPGRGAKPNSDDAIIFVFLNFKNRSRTLADRLILILPGFTGFFFF